MERKVAATGQDLVAGAKRAVSLTLDILILLLLTSCLAVYQEHYNDLVKLDEAFPGRLSKILELVRSGVQLEMTQKYNYTPPDIRGTNVDPLDEDEFEEYLNQEHEELESGWKNMQSRASSVSLASQEVPDSEGEYRYSKDSDDNVEYSPEPIPQRRTPARALPQPQRRVSPSPAPAPKRSKTAPRREEFTPAQEEEQEWQEAPAPTPPPPTTAAKPKPKPKAKVKAKPAPAPPPQTPSRKRPLVDLRTPSVLDFFSTQSSLVGRPGPSTSSQNEKGKGKGKEKP